MKLRYTQFLFRLALSGGMVGLLVWRIDIGDAFHVFLEVHWLFALPGLALYTIAKLVDVYRWRMMLSKVGHAPVGGLFGAFLVSNMANNFLPVRLGDVIRVQLPAKRYGMPRAGITATVFVTETLVDGVAFVILALAGVLLLDVPGSVRNLVWGLLGLVLIGVALTVWAARFRLPGGWHTRGVWRWLPAGAHKTINDLVPPFVAGLAPMADLRLASRIVLISLVAWLLEAGMFWLMGFAFDLDIDIGSYILIMIAANMIVSMPIASSNIGPYEVAVTEVVVALGAQRDLAGGFAIGTHLLNIAWTTLCGLAAMWIMNIGFTDLFRLRSEPPPPSSEPELA